MVTMGKTMMPQSSVHGAGACSSSSLSACHGQDMTSVFLQEEHMTFINSDYVLLVCGETEYSKYIIMQFRDMKYSLGLNDSLQTTDYRNKIYSAMSAE